MNQDDRLHQYFTARAHDVAVPAADLAHITRRGRRRHQGRVALRLAAILAVLGVLGLTTAAVANRGSGGDRVQGVGAALTPSDFDWTPVTPHHGLGWNLGQLAATDTSIYAVSTGPGRSEASGAQRLLYRSDDGTNWSSTPLPERLRPSAITGDGDRLYAVGTSPAGGGSDEQVEVATTTDGGAAWERTTVPLDLAAIGHDFPGRVEVSAATIVRSSGRTGVAVRVRGVLARSTFDPLVEARAPGGCGWWPTREGIEVSSPSACDPAEGSKGAQPATTVAPSSTTTAAAPDATSGSESTAGPDTTTASASVAASTDEPRLLRWANLGIDPKVGGLAVGRTLVFASGDDGALTQVLEEPGNDSPLRLFAAGGSFWLVGVESTFQPSEPGSDSGIVVSTTTVRRSPDGVDWTAPATTYPGDAGEVGELAGRAVLPISDYEGENPRLRLVWLDGASPGSVDVDAVAGPTAVYAATGFGPLGFVAAYKDDPERADSPVRVLHTVDGRSFSTVEVPGVEPDEREGVDGIAVTADAVIVRLNAYPAGDHSGGDRASPRQRLFVGTPKG